VLSAIACHTYGKPDMSFIDKAVYLADFIEPLRPENAARAEARRLAYQCQNLDEAMIYVLRHTIERNIARRRPVYDESRRALDFLLSNMTDTEEKNG